MDTSLSLAQLKRRYFAIISLFSFAQALPIAILVLFTQARGLDLLQVGFVFGAYTLAIVLLEVPTGGLADTIGRRRVTLIAVGITLISQLVLVSAFSFWQFLMFAALGGAGRALISGAPEAWFIDGLKTVDEALDIQPPLAQAEIFATISLASATLLGGLLPDWFAFLPAGALLSPLSVPIFASALCFLLLGVVVAILMREVPTTRTPKEASLPRLLREAFVLSASSPVIMLLLLASVATGVVTVGLETFWQPFFKSLLGEQANSTYLFGILLAGSFALASLGSLASIWLSRLLKRRYALVAAVAEVGQLSAILLLAWQTSAFVAAPLFWLAYFSRGVLASPQATLLNNEVPNEKRSSILSIRSLVFALGGFLGSVSLGYLADTFSIRTAWTFAGFSLLVAVACYLIIFVRTRER